MRILIVGGPKTGKTTLANRLHNEDPSHPPLIHTDDFIDEGTWEERADDISRLFDKEGPWIIEGVIVIYTIRRWLRRHSIGSPTDVIYFTPKAHVALTPKQAGLGSSIGRMWTPMWLGIVERGVRVELS